MALPLLAAALLLWLAPAGPSRAASCLPEPFPLEPCPEDRRPPATKVTYPNRQDFLAKKTVFVRLRSSEDATANASGQLEVPRWHTIYGIYSTSAPVAAGEKVKLRLRMPRTVLEAAERAIARGRKAVVKVTVIATDEAGNRSGATVATIKQKR